MASSLTLDESSPYPWILKDPAAVLDYTFDWSSWLQASETIQTVVWTPSAQLTASSPSHTNTSATVFLSGGAPGAKHLLTCKITTNQGRTDARSIEIRIAAR